MEKVNLGDKLAQFSEQWKSKIGGGVPGSARRLEEGEFLIVPRGLEHRAIAEEEAHVLLFEPASTLNAGNMQNERTVDRLNRI